MKILFFTQRPSKILLFSLFIFTCFFPLTKLAAQGNLFVLPKRAVFEGRDRVKELTLSNTGHDTARYEISFIHYNMKEDGSLVQAKQTDSSFLYADPFLRFFPRTVTLAPGESQVVRLQLTRNGELQTGEYRSHLYFRAAHNKNTVDNEEGQKADSAGFSIQLKPLVGVAVPVLIRVGESSTTIALSNCSFENKNTPTVNITLVRSGNMSFYGDVTVDHISPDGKVTRVGLVKGIAVYTPNPLRRLRLALAGNEQVDYSKGKLHIVYRAQENQNPTTIAQTEIALN